LPLPKFDFIAPETLNEVYELLEKYGEKARLKAGGTDLLIKMNNRVVTPELLIGLKQIKSLDYIKYDEVEGLRIGATTTLSKISSDPLIKDKYPSISYAASVTATTHVRNSASVVGNLCNAAPSADNAPALLALDAKAELSSKKGSRVVRLEDFFKGPGLTCMERKEVFTELKVPVPKPNSMTIYKKISPRSKVDIAIVNVGVMVQLDGDSFKDMNIFLGAVAPIPVRAKEAEKVAKGAKVSEDIIYKIGKAASDGASPITDVRSSKEYRKLMVEILTRRAIFEAVSLIQMKR